MIRGLFLFGAIVIGGLVTLMVVGSLLLPLVGLATTLLVAAIKLAFLLAIAYFIVKLVSPETADRALDKVRSTVRRAA
jgi:hypothetical protein